MKKYTKSTTTYTLRKRSQGINGGTIYERDWTTLGEHLRFGNGKTPLYYDGNFIFTTSNIQLPSRRNKPISVTDTLTYKDVKDAKSTVNNITVNTNSDDIRSFAYYGSCVELVEGSISHIIKSFPACIYSTNNQLEFPVDDSDETIYEYISIVINGVKKDLYILSNPFLIDLTSKTVELTDNDNSLRFMCESYENYEINGERISGYDVTFDINSNCPNDDMWYIKRAPIFTIKFETINGKIYYVYGFKVYDDIVFMSEYNADNKLTIQPNDELIEKYFDELKGFERQLLNRKTNPIYSNIFLTPVEGKVDYKYVNRRYKWPVCNDYCIDIETSEYNEFVQKLLSMATTYDELWCDNLYSRMTHEAIKNFDWTYTKDYIDGEEQDNIDGGLRMQQILHLYGRVFDELKQYIDGIKNNNNLSYNNVNNAPDAVLSDKLELNGWDTISTIMLGKDNNGYTKLTNNFFDKYSDIKWFNGLSIDDINTSVVDVNFMKRLLLSSKRIFSSKGTQESIDMIMGMFGFGRDKDYKVTEYYYEADAKLIDEDDINNIRNKINNKNSERTNYAEDNDIVFENLPLKEQSIKIEENGKNINKTFVIPYYNKNYDYGHELYFQSKGGWGKYGKINSIENISLEEFGKYSETVSYLNVVTTIDNLFSVSSMISNKGDIYYVVNLENYAAYYNTDNDKVSHFFVLMDEISPSDKGSWKNIFNVYENIETQNYLSENEWSYYKEKAEYLDGIVNKTIGNNPHVGFGFYDDGNEYKNYLNEPFKYYIDEGELSITDEEGNIDTELNNEINNFNLTLKEGDKFNTVSIFNLNGNFKCHLNSKVIYFKNNINNDLYKKYFKEIILHYLMQVIPSTTILILENI